MRSRLIIILMLQFYIFSLSCGGGGGGAPLTTGNILGPTSIQENGTAQFSIIASGDTGITYLWAVNPVTGGIFTHGASMTASFTAADVATDTTVVIQVTLTSDNYGPVVISMNITITNTPLTVGTILGVDSMNELATEQFSINASGDAGITYLWTVTPSSAGNFTNDTTNIANFTAADVIADTTAQIHVTVDSDSTDPVIRTHNLTINNVLVPGWAQNMESKADPDLLGETAESGEGSALTQS